MKTALIALGVGVVGFIIGQEVMRVKKDREYEDERRIMDARLRNLEAYKERDKIKRDKKKAKKLAKPYSTFSNKVVDDDGDVTYKASHVREDGEIVGVSISPTLFEPSSVEPYLVHRDDNIENGLYDILQWTLYSKDRVLLDEDDNVIEEEYLTKRVPKTFDPQLLECFGYLDEEPDVILIRNDTLMIQYEITRVDLSHAEDVLGIISDGVSDD